MQRQLFTVTQLDSDMKEEVGLEQSLVLSQGEIKDRKRSNQTSSKGREGKSEGVEHQMLSYKQGRDEPKSTKKETRELDYLEEYE